MNLAKRFLFYFGGFAIGLILLYFFVGGSGASCDYAYGPNARTLKNIKNKQRFFSQAAVASLRNNALDTSAISSLLANGNVLFSESNTTLDSCKVYVIEGPVQARDLKITVENCEKKATVLVVDIK
ncbi:MAG: hypothetical protein AAFP76_08940 [Bacteroidota bacterium]